jgi:hypothetical protein
VQIAHHVGDGELVVADPRDLADAAEVNRPALRVPRRPAVLQRDRRVEAETSRAGGAVGHHSRVAGDHRHVLDDREAHLRRSRDGVEDGLREHHRSGVASTGAARRAPGSSCAAGAASAAAAAAARTRGRSRRCVVVASASDDGNRRQERTSQKLPFHGFSSLVRKIWGERNVDSVVVGALLLDTRPELKRINRRRTTKRKSLFFASKPLRHEV